MPCCGTPQGSIPHPCPTLAVQLAITNAAVTLIVTCHCQLGQAVAELASPTSCLLLMYYRVYTCPPGFMTGTSITCLSALVPMCLLFSPSVHVCSLLKRTSATACAVQGEVDELLEQLPKEHREAVARVISMASQGSPCAASSPRSSFACFSFCIMMSHLCHQPCTTCI